MLIETIKPDFEHNDSRGTIKQLIRRGYSQINVITSKAGVIRGGHYHKYNTEAFYIVSGRCRVTVTESKIAVSEINETGVKDSINAKDAKEKEVREFRTGDFFRVGPYVLHDFEYLEDTTVISMYSLGVELNDETMDIYA